MMTELKDPSRRQDMDGPLSRMRKDTSAGRFAIESVGDESADSDARSGVCIPRRPCASLPSFFKSGFLLLATMMSAIITLRMRL